jgi:ABC-2 type transport system permease protein
MSAASTPIAAGGSRPSSVLRDLGLVAWQIRYEQRGYWRNRARGLFTFVFPLMFLVIFGSIDKGARLGHGPHAIGYDDFFVPGILAYAVIATTYVNLAISTAILRDEGVLKRMQGTPLPRSAYVAARIASTVLIMLAITVVTLGLGVAAYGVHLRATTIPGLLITLVLGTAAFSTLGMGITRFIPNAETAPVVINLTVLPLTFLSGVWFPVQHLPRWLNDIAAAFPIRPLANGLQTAFNPFSRGAGVVGSDVRTLIIWAVVGIFLMLRFLRRPQGEAR